MPPPDCFWFRSILEELYEAVQIQLSSIKYGYLFRSAVELF
jgi:hypothetical protein